MNTVPETASTTTAASGDHSAGSGSYQVVARRYRPQTFAELVGQTHIAQALSNAMTSGRVGHAYLFTGARGVGKTSTARIFAKSLNCVEGPTTTPCGHCEICRNVSTGEDIDVLEIDGASNRGIDEIRQLRQNASICPSRARFKIYIIDEVHMLTREAFNALLKTLEEPPGHVKFIFCTTEPTKIPITILSRCQRFDFAGIETTAIADRLAQIAAEEKVTVEDGVFDTLARRAAGSMRDAQSLLEQLLSFAPEHIRLTDVHEMLGTANDQLLFRIVEAMIRCEPTAIFTELDAAASSGVDFGILVEQMMGLLRDMLVVGAGGDAKLLLFCSPPQFEVVKQHATAFGLHRILASLQILDQTNNRMRFSTQARILTELAFVRIAHLDHFQMVSELLDQLKSGHLAGTTPPAAAVRPVQRAIEAPPPRVAQEPEPARQNVPGPQVPAREVPARQSISGSQVPAPQRQDAPSQTPQQRLAAQTTAGNVNMLKLDDAKAAEIWSDVADAVPGAPGRFASSPISVKYASPNLFIVAVGSKFAKDCCDREMPRFQNALCQKLGQAVRIRFDLIEEKETVAAAPVVSSRAQQTSKLRAAAENPMVQKVEALFDAELYDVK